MLIDLGLLRGGELVARGYSHHHLREALADVGVLGGRATAEQEEDGGSEMLHVLGLWWLRCQSGGIRMTPCIHKRGTNMQPG